MNCDCCPYRLSCGNAKPYCYRPIEVQPSFVPLIPYPYQPTTIPSDPNWLPRTGDPISQPITITHGATTSKLGEAIG